MCEKYLYGSEGGAGHDRPYPYPRRQKKAAQPPLKGADGVARSASPTGRSLKKSSGEIFRPKHFAELTTPSAPLRWLRDFFLLA